MSSNQWKPETRAAQALHIINAETGAVAPPIHPSATFARDDNYELIGNTLYSRYGSPIDPTFDVTDIAAAAHAAGALLVTDGTCAPPCTTHALDSGADISFHSATKYLNGHSDVTAGVLSVRDLDPLLFRRHAGCVRGPAAGPRHAHALCPVRTHVPVRRDLCPPFRGPPALDSNWNVRGRERPAGSSPFSGRLSSSTTKSASLTGSRAPHNLPSGSAARASFNIRRDIP